MIPLPPPPPPPPPPRPRNQTANGAPTPPPAPSQQQRLRPPPPLPPLPRQKQDTLSSPHAAATSTFLPSTPAQNESLEVAEPSSFATIPPPTGSPSTRVYEPYGEVNASSSVPSSSYGLAHRRVSDTVATVATPPQAYGYGQGTATSYTLPPLGGMSAASAAKRWSTSSTNDNTYQHNVSTMCFLIPSLASILWWHESLIIPQVFLAYGLMIYAMDLMNTRDGMAIMLWVGAPVLAMVSGFGTLLQAEDAEATGPAMILYLVQLAVEGLMFVCVSCWGTLQFQWLYKDAPSVAVGMERALHSVLPPVSSSILTYHFVRFLMDYWGLDRVSTLAPHVFAGMLASGMLFLSSLPASFDQLEAGPSVESNKQQYGQGQGQQRQETETSGLAASSYSSFAISTFSARFHSMVLLLVPGTMHVLMYRHRIFSRYASFDEVFDVILVWTVPYLLHYGILLLSESSPYATTKTGLFPRQGQTTLRGTLLPMVISLAGSIALQQRYVVPLCHAVSYQFNGHDLPSTLIVTAYLTLATSCALFALWTWGRTSSLTNELIFGEYHEDVVQLCVSAMGLCVGKAFGIPWNLTPLPILAFLGLSVWITTRMLRYLSIFLFVVHAAGVVLFSYRFAAIDTVIPLALPTVELGLVRFGMAGVFASVMIGLVAGFVVRPAGGFGASFLKRVDIAGILAVLYSLLLTILEITLLKRPVPDTESMGNKDSDVGAEDEDYLYDHATTFLTGAMMIGVSLLAQRLHVISTKSSMVSIAIAIGKIVAVFIDANEEDGRTLIETRVEAKAERVLFRSMVASLLLVIISFPHAILKPIHIKTTARYKRSISNGKPLAEIPAGAQRMILAYNLVILPAILLATTRYVLTPLTKALSAHYGGGAYYRLSPPISTTVGFALALWGVASLSMLNHYLPDGGGETWKKASALTLLMGLGVAISAPTLPDFVSGGRQRGLSSPYASISSLGRYIISKKNRTGGWGILAASLATLLAVTGPLELKERKPPSGRKDKFLLLRLMMFSILFGSGVSWFITIQSMSQEHILMTTVAAIGCMVISFFGTVACVLAYHLELDNFDEVDQITRVWIGAFVIFGLITGAPQLVATKIPIHAFGVGGWLSTYLIVSGLVTFSFACVLRVRSSRNQTTRRLGNLSCIISWLFAITVLYGQFGVAGLDDAFAVTNVMGIPAPILGTVFVSPLLLVLQGEESNERRGRVSRLSSSNTKAPAQAIGVTLSRLKQSNRWVPLVAGTVLVFLFATLYAILLRGSPIFGGSRVAKNHVEVFANVFGRKGNDLSRIAERAVSHSQSLVTSARLAGSGVWTADNVFGPVMHLGGIVATLPNLVMLISQPWYETNLSKAGVTLALPLNVIPIILCKGIPSLRALGVIGTLGGIFQLLSIRRSDRRSQMRI